MKFKDSFFLFFIVIIILAYSILEENTIVRFLLPFFGVISNSALVQIKNARYLFLLLSFSFLVINFIFRFFPNKFMGFCDKNRAYLFVALFIPLIFLNIIFFDYTMDDAFITFRYGNNLVKYGEIIWNVGEDPVEGYSNFLLVPVSAFLIKLGLDVVFWIKILGGVSIFLVFVVIFKLTGVLFGRYSLVPVALLAFNPFFAFHSTTGMETIFFTLFFVLAVYFFCTKNLLASSFFFLLLSLTRIEGVIFFALTTIYYFFKYKNFVNTLKLLLPFSISYLPYFFWRINYYGYFFPNPFYIKQEAFGGLMYTIYFLAFISPFILFFWKKQAMRNYFSLLIATQILITLNVNPIMGDYFRFFIPILPFVFLLASPSLTSFFIKRKKSFFSLAFIFLIFAYPLIFLPYMKLTSDVYTAGLESAHIPMGKWLKENVADDKILAVSDTGAIPFYSGLKTIDILGLNDLHIAHQGFSTSYVLARNPDIIVLPSRTFENFTQTLKFNSDKGHFIYDYQIYTQADFQDRYSVVNKFKHNDNLYFWVFFKNNPPKM